MIQANELAQLGSEELANVTKELQQNCHLTVRLIMQNTKVMNVQDATNVWIYKKLADLEIRMRKIESLLKTDNNL